MVGSWHPSHLRVKSPACPIFWSRTKAAFQVPAVLAELRLDVYVITFPHTLSTENFWGWTSRNQSQEVSKGHCSTNKELCFTVLTSAKMHEQTPFAAAKRKPLSKIHCSSAFWVFWHRCSRSVRHLSKTLKNMENQRKSDWPMDNEMGRHSADTHHPMQGSNSQLWIAAPKWKSLRWSCMAATAWSIWIWAAHHRVTAS